jgi:putative salt-induced outer membrane protein
VGGADVIPGATPRGLSYGMRFPLLALGCLLAAGPVAAQNPDTTKLTVGLGLVTTSGNTNVTTFNFGNSFSYIAHPWVLSEAASMIYGSSHDTVNNDQYHLLLRVDYALHDGLSAYVYGGFDRDRFAGIVSRYQEAAGIAWKAVEKPADLLTLEVGLGENQQRDVGSATTASFVAARGAVTYKHMLNKTAYAQEAAEILPDLQHSKNLRINSATDLVAPLSTTISLKVGYVIRFDNLPPVGFKKTDRILTTGVQITF